ncbi:MAG TPA: rod shape-determining protein RodA [bacterium]|nr:rod shape-determining protein RodA [bacterium]HPS29255.1 rod shape-determining protein RodA [bacterium]
MSPRRKFDIGLIFPVIMILSLGLVSLSSALSSNQGRFNVQIIWVALCIVVFLFTSYSDLRTWERFSIPIFTANIILLVLVLIIGKKIGGAQRWLDLGFMNFQISELTKVSIILFMSYRLNMKPTLEDGYNLFDLVPEVLALLIPVILIYFEPDLGTAILISLIALIMIISTKINRRWLAGLIIFLIVTSPLLWNFVMKDYQKKRIVAIATMMVSDTSEFMLTSQYHTHQSIIAVGSGKFYGKGYKKGTQNMLNFIPEHHTDFIFSVYAEEFGFAGVSILILLYLYLLAKIISMIGRVQDKFSALMLVGTASLIWLQVLINIGMVIGMLPVVGIPLPFFSYGGSSLLSNSFLLGIVHNISVNRRY